MGQVVLINVKRSLGADKTHPLGANTPPEETATWSIDVQAPDKPWLYKSDWRLKQGDKAFGSTLSAYLIVLPEGASELEEKIRKKVEELHEAPERERDRIIKEITELIKEATRSFFEQLIDDLLGQWCGSSALMLPIVLLFWWRRR